MTRKIGYLDGEDCYVDSHAGRLSELPQRSTQSTSWRNRHLAMVVLVPLYVTFFSALQFYARYTTPLHCAILPFLAVVFSASLAEMKRQEIAVRAFFVAMIASFALFAGVILHTGVTNSPQAVGAGFIQQYFDHKGVRIGAFQSGVIGYFNDDVINLDGKVNSRALKALQTNSLEQYIDATHIDVIIDWPSSIHGYLSEQWLTGWQPCARQPKDTSVCLVRRGAEFRIQ